MKLSGIEVSYTWPWRGLDSLRDLDRNSSCWELVLGKEVRLLVGLSGGGGRWFWGESGVGTWAGLEVGVGLNSSEEWQWLTDSRLYLYGEFRGLR